VPAMGELPTDPAIRPARGEDADSLRELLRHLHPQTAHSSLPRIRQEAETLVAADDGRIIGLAVVTLVDYGVEAYGSIEELVVEPAHRQRGIGRALLARCQEWFDGRGVDVVFVSALDERAASFYFQEGFRSCTGPWLYRSCTQPPREQA
jgi:N-acetylglutamate synthase-like GNAT family acetyltransferase